MSIMSHVENSYLGGLTPRILFIIQKAIQIFHIDRRKPSDLEPGHIVDGVNELCRRSIIVCGDSDP